MRRRPQGRQPRLVTAGLDTQVGRATSVRKLPGQFYTPPDVARRVLDLVRWPADGATLLDPACGDGVFLEAAVERARATGLSGPRLARLVSERLEGWDLDPEALAACRARLDAACSRAGCPEATPRLVHRDALDAADAGPFGCVVGNPPYLEAKRMPRPQKARLADRFPLAARGAFDLYGAFVELGARLAAPASGELCLLIPNRFLVAGYAAALRERLLCEATVSVTDLSRERVFADAAVYPIALHARFGEPPERAAYPAGAIPVLPDHPAGRALLARVLSAHGPLSRLASISWTVSFHRAGLRDRYVFPDRPDGPHARRFLGGARFAGNREVEPCRIAWAGGWIDYDEERARADRNPLPPAALFEGDKLVVCQNARRARAAVDRDGLVLKDTLLAVRSRSDAPPGTLEWLALVLHSDLFHYLYEHLYAGTRKAGGYLHFLARYLDPFPVPPPPAGDTARQLYARCAAGAGRTGSEALVRRAYGVTPDEAQALEAYPFP